MAKSNFCPICGGLGFLVGVALTESRPLYNTFYPYIVALQCMPKVALAPLLVIWLGFGISSKVTVVALLCFFPVLVNTISGIRGVSTETRARASISSSSTLSSSSRHQAAASGLPASSSQVHDSVMAVVSWPARKIVIASSRIC